MIRAVLLSTLLVLSSAAMSRAADFNGTWKGNIEFNGESVNLVYDLKVDGDKLTGTVEGPAGKLDLEKGKVDGGKISFEITFGDNHIKHDGKLSGGKIKITSHMTKEGIDYTISRTPDFSGKWKGEAKFLDGVTRELTYDLKLDGDKLTGSVESPRGTIDLSDVKMADDGFTFVTKRGDVNIDHEVKWVDGKLNVKVKTQGGDIEYQLSRVVEITGLWEATFKDESGNDLPLKFDMKVDGDKLTGTVKSAQGDGEFKNGKIKGNEISFDVDFQGNTITHQGTLDGKDIKLKVNGFGTSWDLTLKRAAAK